MKTIDPVETLLAATAAGDRNAFRRLYEATAPRLLAVALAILRRRDWAEEAVQEAFLKVWRGAESFTPDRGRGLPWMVAIVRYQAINMRSRLGREIVGRDENLVDDRVDPDNDPLEIAIAGNEAGRLWECLDRLGENQKRAVLLAFYRGFSHAELSEAMGRPLGTVKSWVRRALINLKECLDNETP